MNVKHFNREGSAINSVMEGHTLNLNLLFADKIICNSNSLNLIMVYMEMDAYPDDLIIKIARRLFGHQKDSAETIDLLEESYTILKKLSKQKYKDKTEILRLGKLKSITKKLKGIIFDEMESFLVMHSLYEIIPFIIDGNIQIKMQNSARDEAKEDIFLEEIADTIIKRDAFLTMDIAIEGLFKHTTLDSDQLEFSDFIKIPLFNIPPFLGMKYEQIKYTRNSLQEGFAPLKKDLQDLSEQLFNIPYTAENQHQIRQLCNEKIVPHVEPIRQKIDDSMYLSKSKNQLSDDFLLKMMLGITSAEVLVRYYEKMDIIEPYMASEIIQRINRHFDSKASFLFTYNTMDLGKKTLNAILMHIENLQDEIEKNKLDQSSKTD